MTVQKTDVDAEDVVTVPLHVPTFGTKFAPKTVTTPPPYDLVGRRERATGILLTTLKSK